MILNTLLKNKWSKIIFKPIIEWKKEHEKTLLINNDFIEYVRKKKRGLERCSLKVEVIGIGSSYTDCGFYCRNIMNSYNLGLTSADLYTSYWIYVNSLKKMPRLNIVILYYGVFSPGFTLAKSSEKYRQVVYDYFFNIPCQDDVPLNQKWVTIIKDKCARLHSGDIQKDYWGYEKKTLFLEINARDRIITHLREYNREPNQMKWLLKLSQSLNEDGRKLYIVITPFRSDYKQEIPYNISVYQKLYDLPLAQNTLILNYLNSTLFDDSDFGDTDHMNEKGAEKITKEINRVILKESNTSI